jgi:uncharacterized protein YkwD
VRPRLRLALALATLLACVAAVLQAPVEAAAPTATARYTAGVLTATNAERTRRHLAPLRRDRCLDGLARAQAQRMARAGELSHTTPFGSVLRRCRLTSAGENVAQHPGTARAVVRAWMGSDGHRANILHRSFRVIGIGAVRRGGTWWVAQVFGRR